MSAALPSSFSATAPAALAAHLERLLARDPSRLDALARLGMLCEVVLRDESRARRWHVAHIARASGCASPEEAESVLHTRVAAGAATPTERLALAHLLACAGREHEARLHFKGGTVLRELRTDHFAFRVVPGSTADASLAEIAAEREAGIVRLAELFDVQLDHDLMIACTFYESRLHKAVITGDASLAHVVVRAAEMHVVWGPLLQARGVHEDTHVLLGRLGRGSRLLEEGAAMLADRGSAIHRELFERTPPSGFPSVASLADNPTFDSTDPDLAYPIAGSFVAFLAARSGPAALKRVYPLCLPALAEVARDTYGVSLEALEAEWRRALPALAASVPGEAA